MNNLLSRPSQEHALNAPARFEKFNLSENPFPSTPIVNKDSEDRRINGAIYESEIRRREYEQIEFAFLKQAQSDPNHLRLGYIIDTSYIGRGNGKSAFLVNLQQKINKAYCLDISDKVNKCFAVYVTPEPGGRTKTFSSFVDVFFQSILRSGIIRVCLATLRLEAIRELYPKVDLASVLRDEAALISDLNSEEWFKRRKFSLTDISIRIFQNKYLQELPADFPVFKDRNSFLGTLVTDDDFQQYFIDLKKPKQRLDFVFSDLVRFFEASSFNGAYVLVDDFERIPDFQSARQKRDFALELRSCLFDGLYANARVGFYDFLLVLHAGVPRLISDAWAASGMENRAPISPRTSSKHVVPFEKLSKEHASLLLKKYLAEYRLKKTKQGDLFPFTDEAVSKIGELSEYNAAKILKMAYDLLDKAAESDSHVLIDGNFVDENKGALDVTAEKSLPPIEDAEAVDLIKKAKSQD